jgi:WD40 repeat protein
MFLRRFGLAVLLAGAVVVSARGAAPPAVKSEPLPKEALRRLGTARLRHEGPINRLAFSADGKTLASASEDGTVRLWDAGTGEERGRVHGWGTGVGPVALSADGKQLAFVGSKRFNDGTIVLYDLPGGERRQRLDRYSLRHRLDYHFRFTDLSFSPDGKVLLSGGSDNAVRLWDAVRGGELLDLREHKTTVRAVAFSPDGKTFASISSDRTLLWELKTFRLVWQSADGGNALCFSADGKLLAEGDNPVRIRDVATGKTLHRLHLERGTTHHLALSGDGSKLVVGGTGPEVHVWDVKGARIRHRLGGHHGGARSLALSPDGRTLATASGHVIRFWDVPTGRELSPTQGHQAAVTFVALSDDRRVVVSGGGGEALVWAAPTGRPLQRLADAETKLRPVALARDGKTLVTAQEKLLRFWHVEASRSPALTVKREVKVQRFGWASPDLGVVLSWGYRHPGQLSEVEVRDAVTNKKRCTLEGSSHDSGRNSIPARLAVASADGGLVALTEPDDWFRGARLWDGWTGEEIPLPSGRRGLGGGARSLAISDDGAVLAVGWSDGLIERLDTATGRPLRVLHGHKGAVNGLAFTPDGRTLVSAGEDGAIRLWETATGKVRHDYDGHRGAVTAVGVGGRGRVVVSGGADTTVLLWAVWPEAARTPAKWSDREADALWADLGSPSAKIAFRAARALAQHPAEAAGLLRARLRPVAAPDRKKVAGLVEGLGSDDFDVRQDSEAALKAMGEAVADDLRRALAGKPSPEAAARLRRLIEHLSGPASDDLLRDLRAVEALEHGDSAQGRALLKEIGEGAKGARLTRAARESLRRAEAARR